VNWLFTAKESGCGGYNFIECTVVIAFVKLAVGKVTRIFDGYTNGSAKALETSLFLSGTNTQGEAC